jgi:hypothetical protein
MYVAAVFAGSATAETTPSAAPVSHDDVQQITRVIGAVTNKPILMIASVLEDSYVRGAVIGNAYELDTNTGKRTPQYIRTDLVSVCPMPIVPMLRSIPSARYASAGRSRQRKTGSYRWKS